MKCRLAVLSVLFAVLLAIVSAAPQRTIIEKTIITRPGFGNGFGQSFNQFGRPGFNQGFGPGGFGNGFNRGGGFNRGPTIIKETIFRPGK